MKIGILIPVYNRQQYLKETLWSLERLELPDNHILMVINDASTDAAVNIMLNEYFRINEHRQTIRMRTNDTNLGVKKTLLSGYEALFAQGCTHVINFDSDTLIKPNAVTELVKHYIPGTLLTGFHCTTMGRHPIIEETETLYKKQSVGGINFCVDRQAYEKYIKPALKEPVGNWDHSACRDGAYCLKQSVVQHIGLESSLGHHDTPDVADDFKYWDLPDVTLMCVDSQPGRLQSALAKCTEQINFGQVQLLSPDIKSKEEYSHFMMYESYKHIHTSHVLIFQHDGYVNNWKAWDNDWLQYDYIGAPWWYNDGHDVGNGGFSLRSQRLMQIVATDPRIKEFHPEDHQICRTYRTYLEQTYNIRFAPKEVAEKFSFEGFRQPDKFLKDQFGKHGNYIRTEPVKRANNKYVVGQFASLGDILWLVPLIRALQAEGNTVLWPVNPEYVCLDKHFPDLNFVDRNQIPIDYESRRVVETPYGRWLPYRFASENMGLTLRNCMDAKYRLFGHDWKMFRELTWERDYHKEAELYDLVVKCCKPYILANRLFGAQGQFKIQPQINSELRVVEMKPIPGYTLLDWGLIIENATEIHAANTSILYMLEAMQLDMPIHLYNRGGLWGEVGFSYTQFIHSKPYILH